MWKRLNRLFPNNVNDASEEEAKDNDGGHERLV